MEHTLEQSAAQALVPAIAITDGELLMRFAQHGDEQAFAALVEKHGRLVWTVCWQVLREHHAIEDAFQSTFFILAKRARSIRSCDSLCGWLYRVAYRTALRSRMSNKAKLLSALGTEASAMEEWSEFDEKLRTIEQDEQRAALLEELQSLPEKYQQILALCYLEGKTRRTIADELGCSLETVKGRLARGRQVLRHRLIRRGVSLSLAMAAMSIPVKVATAAVTPNLIGLTVTGATAFAAGTLGIATLASGTGVAKATATASTQVIHLAQQGTVAMTIASFAKPAVIAVALLGAVSGTLAIDSDAPQGGGKSQTIDLTSAAEGETTASQDITVESEGPVVTVAAVEESTPDEAPDKQDKKTQSLTWNDQDVVVEKQRVPAPPRSPQPVKVRTPGVPSDVLIPAMPPMPEAPVVAPLNVRDPHLDLKLQIKMAELEIRASQLQLESKQLEIRAMGAGDEAARKALLHQSREKLVAAEAEKLKIQIEQQQSLIKALEEAVQQQAEQVGKQARSEAEMAESYARRAAEQAEKAVSGDTPQAAVQAKEAAQTAQWKIQERSFNVDPNSDQPFADPAHRLATTSTVALPVWEQSIEAQQGAMSLQPGNRIQIEIIDGDSKSIDVYTVEPMGTVALGADYGRAEVKGMSVIDAEEVIAAVIKKITENAKVQVTYLHAPATYNAPIPPGTPAISDASPYVPFTPSKPSKNEEPK